MSKRLSIATGTLIPVHVLWILICRVNPVDSCATIKFDLWGTEGLNWVTITCHVSQNKLAIVPEFSTYKEGEKRDTSCFIYIGGLCVSILVKNWPDMSFSFFFTVTTSPYLTGAIFQIVSSCLKFVGKKKLYIWNVTEYVFTVRTDWSYCSCKRKRLSSRDSTSPLTLTYQNDKHNFMPEAYDQGWGGR